MRAKHEALAEVHAELQHLFFLIEIETSREVPDMASLAAVRLKLTQASRRRTAIVNTLIDEQCVSSDPARKAQLHGLRADQQNARMTSAHHIGEWTTRSIAEDWQGYRDASKKIRADMRQQISKEALLLLSR